MTHTALAAATVLATLTTLAPAAHAEGEAPTASTTAPAGFHADVEVDPTAYALSGHSIHVGLGARHVRVDLGAFAMDLPHWAHGNDGYDASFSGYGLKLQVFPFAEQSGLFLGVDGGVARLLVKRTGTDLAVQQLQGSVGVHLGYRIGLPLGFYATPWIGVSRQLGTKDVTLAGADWHQAPVNVFPAVHLGYRFL